MGAELVFEMDDDFSHDPVDLSFFLEAIHHHGQACLGFYPRGFRCYRREVLEAINLEKIRYDGYAFQIEIIFKPFGKGFKVREIPITFKERQSGVSKISLKVV